MSLEGFLLPTYAKLPEDESDRGAVAHFLGIPIGFQFGTAAGLKGIPALLVDILTDPTTYLLGGLGALTKTGEAASAASKLLKGARAVEETASLGEKLVPAAQRALEGGAQSFGEFLGAVKKPLMTAAQLQTDSWRGVAEALATNGPGLERDVLSSLRDGSMKLGGLAPGAADVDRMMVALERGGADGLHGYIQGSIAKREQLRQALSTALGANDWAGAKGAIKEIRALAPTEQWKSLFSGPNRRAWKTAFESAREGVPVSAMAEGARAQVQAGQRALLNLQVPFTRINVPVLAGAGVVGGVAEAVGRAGKVLGLTGKAAEAAQFAGFGDSPGVAFRGFDDVSEIRGGAFNPVGKAAYASSGDAVGEHGILVRFPVGESVEGSQYRLGGGGYIRPTRAGTPNRIFVDTNFWSESGAKEQVSGLRKMFPGVPITEYRLDASGNAVSLSGVAASAAKAAQAIPTEPLQAAPYTLQQTISGAADAIQRSAEQAKDFHDLDISGADLLKERTAGQAAHQQVALSYGAKIQDEYRAAMKGMGLTAPEDYSRVNELLQDRGKYLNRGTATERQGEYGRTSVFGDLTQAAKDAGMTDKHVLMAQSIDSGLRKLGGIATKNGILDALLPDYMARSVRILPGKEEEFRAAMQGYAKQATKETTFWRHAQERTIPAWDKLLELEKKGIVEVEKDPGKLLANYTASFGRVSANASFLDGMAQARVPSTVAGKEGNAEEKLLHLIVPGTKAGDDWARRTGAYVRVGSADVSIMSLARQIGERTRLPGFGYGAHVWVHNDIADSIRAAIEPGFARPGRLPATATGPEIWMAHALEANSVAKRGLLFPGFVHFTNLTQKLLVTLGWDGFKDGMSKLLPNLVKSAGERSYLETLPDMERALRAGVQLDAPLDAEVQTFQRALRYVSDKLPITKPVLDTVRNLDTLMSGKLWGQYHAPMKLYAFNELMTRAVARFPTADVDTLAREVAQHVNASFGGGNLEKLVGSEKGRQLMRLFFLAPDWLIGNTRIATDVFANLFVGKERQLLPAGAVLAQDARAFFARQYALKTGLMMAFAGNFANLAFTGHFMHDNDDPTRIQLPGVGKDGKPLYLAMFDPFLMPFDMVASPMKFIGRKVGPIPRLTSTIIIGHDFTGAPIVGAKDGVLASVADWLGTAAKQVLPIGVQQSDRIPLAYQALSAAGLPVRGSPMSAPAPGKPQKQQHAAAVADAQAGIEKAVSQYAEMHAAMMKSDQYRRGLDSARYAVVPPFALLPQ